MNPTAGWSHHTDGVSLYTGDARAGLAAVPACAVDCLVTSPPYWRLRDYTPQPTHSSPREHSRTRRPRRDDRGGREAAQIGTEPTAQAYIDGLREVFQAARRVLTPRATLWLNLGDSYSTNSDGYHCAQPGQRGQPRHRPRADVAHKNLLGMPWRVALALQDDGWILRSATVWNKPHAQPTPIKDRMATRYELIFLFVTQPDYYFDLDAIRQPYTGDRALSRRAHRSGRKPNTATGTWPRTPAEGQRGRNPGNVWTIPPARTRTGHPAPSPVEIPRRCIAAGCPPAGHVLDPFSGAATTGIAARVLDRRFTGIDTNPDYHALALDQLAESCGTATKGSP